MSDPRPHDIRIFLSTVTAEFKVYRNALRTLLKRPGVAVDCEEDFFATGGIIFNDLANYIEQCHAVVHFVGDMTGTFVDGLTWAACLKRCPEFIERFPALQECVQTGHPPISYTQLEAYLALYYEKPLLIAVPEPGALRDVKHKVTQSQQKAQQIHLRRLRELGQYPGITFSNSDQLAVGVLRSIIFDLLVRDKEFASTAALGAGLSNLKASFLSDLREKEGPVVDNKPIVLPYPSIGDLFKGRQEFLEHIQRSLTRPNGSALAVTNAVHGLGGVGKTRLAVEYGWRYRDQYSAVLFLLADTPENLKRELADLTRANALNLPELEKPEEAVKIAAVERWLRDHPNWLLIVDNADTEEAAAAVEDCLTRWHGGHVLITSRRPDWSGAVEQL